MGDIFSVAKISNIFLGCLKFLIFFFWGGGGVNGRCSPKVICLLVLEKKILKLFLPKMGMAVILVM